jgi:hypothetical protein
MSRVGFEPTIPVFEREKTVHALDGAVTVIGNFICQPTETVNVFYMEGAHLRKVQAGAKMDFQDPFASFMQNMQ